MHDDRFLDAKVGVGALVQQSGQDLSSSYSLLTHVLTPTRQRRYKKDAPDLRKKTRQVEGKLRTEHIEGSDVPQVTGRQLHWTKPPINPRLHLFVSPDST
jgi:hypothetical protein